MEMVDIEMGKGRWIYRDWERCGGSVGIIAASKCLLYRLHG